MNKYLIPGIVGVLVLAAGFFLLGGRTQQTQTITPQEQSVQTEEPQMEEETQTEQATVVLTSSGFEPGTLSIKAGTKVVWENKSGTTAAVNSAIHPIHALFPLLNLGTFNDGDSLSVKFDKPGTYKYHNHLNSAQTGIVIVE